MKNNTERIGSYLQNEMSVEERKSFEDQLSYDKELQQELNIQKQIIAEINNAGLKNAFGKAVRTKFVSRMLIRWGIAVLIISGLVFYAFKTNIFHRFTHSNEIINVVPSTENFVIDNAKDTIIETEEGVVFGIPANAFGTGNKKVKLEIKTAISPEKIMLQGLSTTSDGKLLQTAGMFYINGFVNDKPVSLVKKIDVSVPAKSINPKMQLFNGVQDSSGRINWVDPKPIVNGLRTYDITTLDFYPPNYIPTLKALGKDHTNKIYTDSLYYSFSGYHDYPAKDPDNLKKMDSVTIVSEVPKVSRKVVVIDSDTARVISKDTTLNLGMQRNGHYEIDPARIRAIWDTKFNNTILATKEFEERLRFLHELCTADYFQAYVELMNKPMYEIDQLCAENSTGEIRKKFLEFAARKDGGVMLKEGMQEKLSDYFEKKFKAYREASEKTWAKREEELARLAAIADDKRREQETRDFIREDKNFEQEFCINLTEAYKQIGIKRICNEPINDTIPEIIPPSTIYYNVTIDTVGWKNLDVYVLNATENRESMTYTDPKTGKTATLTYKEISITIQDQTQYENVFVYLLPDSLNSFQRMEQYDNVFREKLNMLFKYDVVAIAYKGDKVFFYKQKNIQPGQYTFSLAPITESELKKILNAYSKEKSNDILNEYEYQLFEQQEAIRNVQLRKELNFINQLRISIWNCFDGYFPSAEGEDVGNPNVTTQTPK